MGVNERLRASIERLRQQLRLRNFYDDFAWPRENQLFAGDFFDEARIGLQRSHLIAQFQVLLVQAIQIFFDSVNFALRAAHGDKAVRTEDVVYDQRENE